MALLVALLRTGLPARGATALGLLSSRQFSTNSEVGDCLVGPPSVDPSALDLDAPAAAAPAALSDAAADATITLTNSAASMDLGGPVGLVIQAVDALHAATGAPWWATISAVGIAVRLAMVPISLRAQQASAAAMPLFKQAQQQVAEEVRLAGGAGVARNGQLPLQQQEQDQAGGGRQQRWPPKGDEEQQAQQAQEKLRVDLPLREVWRRYELLRRQAGTPHPAWVVVSPLIQLPFFVTAMMGVRRMSLAGWQGFDTGGLAWFKDLTLPAVDLETLTAPMGELGIILPMAVAVSMYANIDAAFSAPAPAAGRGGQSPMMLFIMDKLRLLLEWMVVPMFAISLQLPQGALCYWATTSTFSLAQNHAFHNPAMRKLLGLPSRGLRPPLPPAAPQANPQAAGAGAAAVPLDSGAGAAELAGVPSEGAGANGAGKGWTDQDEAALRHFLATTRDQMKLFRRAAELRAEGKVGAAINVLRRLLQLYPKNPRALYGLGQMHATLKDWRASEIYYQDSANNEQDKQLKARSWFGVGVALRMQGEHDAAIQAFQKVAKFAQEDELRLHAWIAEASEQKRLGNTQRAVELLEKAAAVEPKVEEIYLQPLLNELEGKRGAEGPLSQK